MYKNTCNIWPCLEFDPMQSVNKLQSGKKCRVGPCADWDHIKSQTTMRPCEESDYYETMLRVRLLWDHMKSQTTMRPYKESDYYETMWRVWQSWPCWVQCTTTWRVNEQCEAICRVRPCVVLNHVQNNFQGFHHLEHLWVCESVSETILSSGIRMKNLDN